MIFLAAFYFPCSPIQNGFDSVSLSLSLSPMAASCYVRVVFTASYLDDIDSTFDTLHVATRPSLYECWKANEQTLRLAFERFTRSTIARVSPGSVIITCYGEKEYIESGLRNPELYDACRVVFTGWSDLGFQIMKSDPSNINPTLPFVEPIVRLSPLRESSPPYYQPDPITQRLQIRERPDCFNTLFMLFCGIGCCLSRSTDLLFDDASQSLSITTCPGYCCCCRSHYDVGYTGIANVTIAHVPGVRINKQPAFRLELHTTEGEEIPITEPKMRHQLQNRYLCLHQYVFGRADPSRYRQPTDF